MSKLVLFLCFLALGTYSEMILAEEVDDYVRSSAQLGSSSASGVNHIINSEMEKFAKSVSEDGEGSRDPQVLAKKAFYFFNSNFSSVGNRLKDDELSGQGINYARSPNPIYSSYKESDIPCCVSTVNINGRLIGIDKIDHFFGNGGMLFEEYLNMNPKDESLILDLNTRQETGGWGLSSSGLKSYGDLAANWAAFDKDWKARNFKKNLVAESLTCPSQKNDCDKIMDLYKGNAKALNTIVSPICLKKILRLRIWSRLMNVQRGCFILKSAHRAGSPITTPCT